MKYLIASDIHGSALWCRKLLERFEAEAADGLWLLGDILYHGPRNDLPDEYSPKKVIAMLNPLKDKILCVRGNCDAEVDQMVLDFPIMDEMKAVPWPERAAGRASKIVLTHGHHINKDTFDCPETVNRYGAADGGYLIYGHFHVPLKTFVRGMWCLNPGSVSIPKEGSSHSYMVFEDGAFFWKDMEGNIYDSLVADRDVMYN